ncbi:aminoglycoside phosphotransferase [Thermaerobacter marianensis DSM 12885]|uniref:Aminoglycoside phosphotransferase n=1 Tax=Thermaerobacter marianensis (strain ATCC 700841 / DSM 12885 / JCM 10246 / 7p75a) TaxID=644966 RepID=E6SM84_THEM7|nr:phosphotransferase family protein [Thermaerobacter marianensis]ADU51443.1 aminoglycoside phosphotransferase [Thermaerobacter marianensis DSM 12885]
MSHPLREPESQGERRPAAGEGGSGVPPGTIPVRPGEELDLAAVAAFLARHVPDFPGPPLEVRQFAAGASNLTYWLRAGTWQAVLRRPPFGPLPPKAHDMVREATVLRHLHPAFPLAPRPLAVCADPSVLGVPFYVMEYRPGVVVDHEFPGGRVPPSEQCRKVAHLVVDTLADLHAVDYGRAGLADLGRPQGFVRRQVEGWIGRWRRVETEPIPALDRLLPWMEERVPEPAGTALIHNDFKLNNMILSPALDRVVAVLDWEMATLGDPLFDLGVSLSYWVHPDDPDVLRNGLPTVTVHPGFIRRGEFVHRYALRTGRDVSGIGWYLVFAYFKLAVILQQIYYRWRAGQTRDRRFASFGEKARGLIQLAAEAAAAGGGEGLL